MYKIIVYVTDLNASNVHNGFFFLSKIYILSISITKQELIIIHKFIKYQNYRKGTRPIAFLYFILKLF